MNEKKMREEFEQQYCAMLSFKPPNELFRRCENGRYVRIDVELYWNWWQAACASKQKEIDALNELVDALLRISDRKHKDWDKVYALLAKGEPK